mmetsp:Transcript_5756/g.9857  ORF Transcript_5756/g.9857 Transcript_5756/m.9857 type:complete len:173 (-) Transcript_5756:724-1242(-)
MEEGEISFTVDGKNYGPASKDKRLKSGKYYAAVLLMSKKDKVTIVNPRKITQSSLGYERMLTKLNVMPKENKKFYQIFEQLQEYFNDDSQERHLHRLVLLSYLNDIGNFEELSKVLSSDMVESGEEEKSDQVGGKSSLTKSQITTSSMIESKLQRCNKYGFDNLPDPKIAKK